MNVRFELEALEERRLYSTATDDIGLSAANAASPVRAAELNDDADAAPTSPQSNPTPGAAPLTLGGTGGSIVGPPAPGNVPVKSAAPFVVFDSTFGTGDVADGMAACYWTSPAP